eukprot:CAMPEP_0182537450 /NCGR_PEP_ID=MMETSP1323-20130603/21978_1 /TAXON_ID=236787 /ORGANISM="Florenciella parvula, Strain RCC1693" /LENGTH=90 /DNA_ID=CAMNT_0024747831 /DNA_START=11 /DNA_END=284 /DNA_ORIENTATION=-
MTIIGGEIPVEPTLTGLSGTSHPLDIIPWDVYSVHARWIHWVTISTILTVYVLNVSVAPVQGECARKCAVSADQRPTSLSRAGWEGSAFS